MKKIVGIVAVALIAMAFVPKGEVNADTEKVQTEAGIKFKAVSFEKAKKMAAESERLIFVDAYTTWCGPCKRMAATSFKEAEVGEIYNERFINLKIDCESQPEGVDFARMYKVRAYPTVFIINPEGKVVKQSVGFMTADQLIAFTNSVD